MCVVLSSLRHSFDPVSLSSPPTFRCRVKGTPQLCWRHPPAISVGLCSQHTATKPQRPLMGTERTCATSSVCSPSWSAGPRSRSPSRLPRAARLIRRTDIEPRSSAPPRLRLDPGGVDLRGASRAPPARRTLKVSPAPSGPHARSRSGATSAEDRPCQRAGPCVRRRPGSGRADTMFAACRARRASRGIPRSGSSDPCL